MRPEVVVHSDGWRGYDGLVDASATRGTCGSTTRGTSSRGAGCMHINGIESFWGYAKRRLAKFNGVPAHTFYLHLKETGYRFNHRRGNLYAVLLRMLRKQPL
ncbi:MAG TPA: transposase [Tepidisphaeraceae bacterium]|nr:transposase [Tepidisphaeraceae bacterium]